MSIRINTMAKSLVYCLFIPVTLLAALCSDTGIIYKFVCIGDEVEVFQNITSTNYKLEITLHKTFYDKDVTIAEWSMQNVSDTDIHEKYKQKVYMENGTIWIRDFQESDEANYVMLYDESSKRKEMQLCALTPPTKRCKANMRQEEHFLYAFLDAPEYCGNPIASVQWMRYPDILYISKTVIELLPETEARTYIACVEGEAIKCMKDSTEWNNCENFTIRSIRENDSPTALSDLPQMNRTIIGTIVIVSLVLLIVIVILYILWRQFGLVAKIPESERQGIRMRNLRLLERHVTDRDETLEVPEEDIYL